MFLINDDTTQTELKSIKRTVDAFLLLEQEKGSIFLIHHSNIKKELVIFHNNGEDSKYLHPSYLMDNATQMIEDSFPNKTLMNNKIEDVYQYVDMYNRLDNLLNHYRISFKDGLKLSSEETGYPFNNIKLTLTELLLNHPVVNDSVLKELDEATQIPRSRPKM